MKSGQKNMKNGAKKPNPERPIFLGMRVVLNFACETVKIVKTVKS